MKNETIKNVLKSVVCPLIVTAVMFLPSVLQYQDGSPGAISSLTALGQGNRFTCIWTDGKTTVLHDERGRERTISLAVTWRTQQVAVGHRYIVVPGTQYRFGRSPAFLKEV